MIDLGWEEPRDIPNAAASGVVARPSRAAVALMLRHLRVARAEEIPVRSQDLPNVYLQGRRVAWLVERGSAFSS